MILWIQRNHKWFESDVEINTLDGPETVRCYRTCMLPGLVVSENPAGRWTLTHEGSGMSVLGPEDYSFPMITDAIECAEKYGGGIDWTGPKTEEMREAHESMLNAAIDRFYELEDLDGV